MSSITAYCACALCCGPGEPISAIGSVPVAGVTIAAPRSVPLGTWVRVDVPGVGVFRRRVEDRTHRRHDGKWDLFVRSHGAARRWGVKRGTVTIEK